MCKKNILDFAPKKDQYILVPNYEFEKKLSKILIYLRKMLKKKLINS